MNFGDFQPDEIFYTATGAWVVLDTSSRVTCVLAKRLDNVDFDPYYDEPTVFVESDFGGCRKEPFPKEEL